MAAKQNRMPVLGEIVKLSPMAIPSKTKWGIDKLGIGEAMFFSYATLGTHGLARLRGVIGGAKKAAWGRGKHFIMRDDFENERVMVYRDVDRQ